MYPGGPTRFISPEGSCPPLSPRRLGLGNQSKVRDNYAALAVDPQSALELIGFISLFGSDYGVKSVLPSGDFSPLCTAATKEIQRLRAAGEDYFPYFDQACSKDEGQK